MSAIVKSGVPGKVPATNQLEYGQLALNYADQDIYYKDNENAVSSIFTNLYGGYRNQLSNGGFDIWNAGTSFTAISGYGPDRWRHTAGSRSSSRQNFSDAERLLYGSRYFYRMDTTVGGATFDNSIFQTNEGHHLAGKYVTVSLLCKTSIASTVNVQIRQYNNIGGTYNSIDGVAIATTTSWQRYTFTLLVPLPNGTIGDSPMWWLSIVFPGTAMVMDMAQIQVELGKKFRGFEHRPTAIDQSICDRYFYSWNPNAIGSVFGTGYSATTTSPQIYIPFPTRMYKVPTLETSGVASHFAVLHQNTTIVCTALPVIAVSGGTEHCRLILTVASGLTVGQGCMLYCNNTSAFLGFRAETF